MRLRAPFYEVIILASYVREGLYRVLLCGSTVILVFNVLLILYSVFTRYILNYSPIWSDELSRYAIVASVMLAMSCAYVDGRHMGIALIKQNANQRVRRAIELYQWFVVLSVSAFFTYVSWRYSLSLGRFSSMGLGVSKSVPLFLLPIGFAALFCMALLQGPFNTQSSKETEC